MKKLKLFLSHSYPDVLHRGRDRIKKNETKK